MTRRGVTAAFLAVQAVLYAVILTAGGGLLVGSSFGAIVLCFAYALCGGRRSERWMVCALAFTVAADFCLVICSPQQRLWGMLFFLAVQLCYAASLGRALWWLRAALCAAAVAVCAAVLGKGTDALALVSVCYYAHLLCNLALSLHGRRWGMAAGFALFALCDAVIGLQVAAGDYLPLPQALQQVLFCDFNLSWFFYLPSQVCLALCSRTKKL